MAERSEQGFYDESGAINLNKFIGASESGLPAWAEVYVKKILQKYAMPSWRMYEGAIRGLEKAPTMIEAARTALNQQYSRDIQTPTMNAVRSALAQGVGRGTLGSSVFGDSMQRIATDALRAGAQQQTQSNVWAQNALLQNLLQKVQARGQMAGLLGDYMGQTRFSYAQDPSAAASIVRDLVVDPNAKPRTYGATTPSVGYQGEY